MKKWSLEMPSASTTHHLASCTLMAAGLMSLAGSAASAQSLFHAPLGTPTTQPEQVPAQTPPADQPSAPAGSQPPTAPQQPEAPAQPGSAPATTAAPLRIDQVGLFVVRPIKPRQYEIHDKVEVVINESSVQSLEQKLETSKSHNLRAELRQFPSFEALLKALELKDGIGANTPNVGINSNRDFRGDGSYERKDRFTARISALIVDVKPNGMLLLEAKESVQSDREIKTMVLTGLCDPKDITSANTVQSAQLASLMIKVQHEGELKDANEKGIIARTLDTIFGP
jgi:flagellar L-ring protein FlgH